MTNSLTEQKKYKKQIWNYPDKEKGFLMLGYNGKRNIIYVRKSNNGKLFLHAGTYRADFMNQILDDRTLKYCFVKDIPNWRYTTKGKFFENHNMKNDSYIELVEDEYVEKLEQQLAEANRVITSYIRNFPLEKYSPAEAYVDRWGVK